VCYVGMDLCVDLCVDVCVDVCMLRGGGFVFGVWTQAKPQMLLYLLFLRQ